MQSTSTLWAGHALSIGRASTTSLYDLHASIQSTAISLASDARVTHSMSGISFQATPREARELPDSATDSQKDCGKLERSYERVATAMRREQALMTRFRAPA